MRQMIAMSRLIGSRLGRWQLRLLQWPHVFIVRQRVLLLLIWVLWLMLLILFWLLLLLLLLILFSMSLLLLLLLLLLMLMMLLMLLLLLLLPLLLLLSMISRALGLKAHRRSMPQLVGTGSQRRIRVRVARSGRKQRRHMRAGV